MTGCPNGCPCPNYQCRVLPAVLILSTSHVENKPIITDLDGNVNEISFSIQDGVEVQSSCSITFRGQFFIYGGQNRKNQVARVEDCSLKDTGFKLPFEMDAGGCTVTTRDQVYLCFGEADQSNNTTGARQMCHKSNNPMTNFTQVTNSSYPHGYTQIAASESKYNTNLTHADLLG